LRYLNIMRNLGLIGGLAVGATMHYYRDLVRQGAGEMLIVNADLDRVLKAVGQNDRAGLAAYLGRLIERLANGGAEVAAISAVAPHMCIRELEKISVLPLVNIIEETGREIRSRGFHTVALVGTRFVMETRMYGMLDGVNIFVPKEIDFGAFQN
jgi:aspartate racemase